MVKCATCGRDIGLGFKCRRCGEYFCEKHRLPEIHDCPNKHLRPEDIAFKLLEERQLDQEDPTNEVQGNQQKPISTSFERMEFDDEEEGNSLQRASIPSSMNLSLSLLTYLIFVVIDVGFLFVPGGFLMIVPLIIHAVFLPYLYSLAQKQKKGQLTPEIFAIFVRAAFTYTIVYLIARVFVSILVRDYFTMFLLLLIGIRLILTWYQLAKLVKIFP